MSWWSDGEPFNEWEPSYCEKCTRKNLTKEKCDRCVKQHEENEEEEYVED